MKKNIMRLVGALLVITVIYFSGIGFYAEKFSANTTYGSVDIGNLTLDEAHAKIEADYNDREFILTEDGEEVARVKVGDLGPVYHDSDELQESYNSQNPNYWVNGIFQEQDYSANLEGVIELDEDKIIQDLTAQGLSNEDRIPAIDATIQYSEEDGYYVEEGEAGTEIDPKLIEAAILDKLQTDNNEIALEDTYAQPEITEDSSEVTDILDTIEEIASIEIIYEISGDEVTIPSELIESWIYFDANNNVIIDSEGIRLYLEELNDEYSTFNTYREFESTIQGTVTVPPGILGWGINIDEEIGLLVNDIHRGQDVQRAPSFHSTGGVPGAANEIGDTYVEIDLTYQTMYLYVDGVMILETPVVSGQPEAETIPGANSVIEMLQDTKLRGFNQFSEVEYATPVDYWIRFDYQAQGIHDAKWQGSFGGNTWTYAGSLGCINTPHWAVQTIYENVDYGTPVIVFY